MLYIVNRVKVQPLVADMIYVFMIIVKVMEDIHILIFHMNAIITHSLGALLEITRGMISEYLIMKYSHTTNY